jgi:hypothetical protein
MPTTVWWVSPARAVSKGQPGGYPPTSSASL